MSIPMYIEGKARIKYTGAAFLNPAARPLRDIGVALAGTVSDRKTKVLDATAATGIRGIRYYLETKAKDVTFLDINKEVSMAARKNVRYNKVKAAVLNKSIREFANTTKEKFDIIDLDPFGSVAAGAYDLLRISRDGTCLMFTATDAAVLSGAQYGACIRVYDARPLHNELCHEVGMRILIGYVARLAAQLNFGIEVLLSMDYLHYMRIALRLKYGAEASNASIRELGYVHYCTKCGFRSSERATLPKTTACQDCGSRNIEAAGKLWLGSLYEKGICSSVSVLLKREGGDALAVKMMDTINAELDIPLYYSVPKLTRSLGMPSVSPVEIIDRLREEGFEATRTQFDPSGIKTTCGIGGLKQMLKYLNTARRKTDFHDASSAEQRAPVPQKTESRKV